MVSFSNIFKIQHKIMEHAYGLINVIPIKTCIVIHLLCAIVRLDIIGMAIHVVNLIYIKSKKQKSSKKNKLLLNKFYFNFLKLF